MFSLAADHMSLLMTRQEQEYEFGEYDAEPDRFIVIAQIMLKVDNNLEPKRFELVPELISDTEFWRNYFYSIELAKSQLGEPHMLKLKCE